MFRNAKIVSAAALVLAGFSMMFARAEMVQDPSTRNKPTMTFQEQEKLKKELIKARDRQSQVKAKDSAPPAKAKKH